MEKSTVQTRVILNDEITREDLQAFDKAYCELLDTIVAISKLVETEILITGERDRLVLMTASMRSMSYQLMELMNKAFTMVSY